MVRVPSGEGARVATPASSAYQACRDLFNGYPLAVSAVNHVPTMQSMILLLQDGDDARFFVLLRIRGEGRPAYTLSPWRADNAVGIAADGGEVPNLVADAVTRGVPIPRDGSMFGWACDETATALIVVYARYTPDRPVPTWSVMPLGGTPETQWPPFTGEHLFGHWFWDRHRTGNIIDIGGLVAANPGTVFWVDTYRALGSDCCAVACDLKTPEGHILRHGAYLDSARLRAGVAVPALAELLADVGKADLAPRFQVPVQGGR
jgi:hypothetical protein